jgi:hypothetical protein
MDSGVIIYGARLGIGGLDMQAVTALRGLTLLNSPLSAIGPEEFALGRWRHPVKRSVDSHTR